MFQVNLLAEPRVLRKCNFIDGKERILNLVTFSHR